MKKILIYTLALSVVAGLTYSCDYLDRSPEAEGFSKEEVFGDSIRYRSYVEYLQLTPIIKYLQNGVNPYGSFDDITDNSYSTPNFDCASVFAAAGNYYPLRQNGWAPMSNNDTWGEAWKHIRIANMGIQNIDMYPGSEKSRDYILGMCYFYRAFSYMELCRRWGGMPYLYEPFTDEEMTQNLDFPRLDMRETYVLAAEDFELAAQYLPNNVPMNEWQHPTRVAALGLKARTLLYAASDQARYEGGQTRESLWEQAALAANVAIEAAEDNGYGLVTMDKYYNLFKGTDEAQYTYEVLFARRAEIAWGSDAYKSCIRPPGATMDGKFGVETNQTLIDSYDMQATGLPITDVASGYKEQAPYIGRDPRFYHNTVYNGQAVFPGRVTEMYNYSESSPGVLNTGRGSKDLVYNAGGAVDMGYTRTGTYGRKWMGTTWNTALPQIWPYIRMAELYLSFAEAANEAWNDVSAIHTGCRYSAVGALNKIRNRAQMPDLDPKFYGKDAFRTRTWNERRVELCFEEHRIFDLRRWKIGKKPEYRDFYGVEITKLAAGYNATLYPTGFKYERKLVRIRTYEDRNDLFVIKLDDTNIGPNFNQNPGW